MRFFQTQPQRKIITAALVGVGAIGTVLLANYVPNVINDIRQRAQIANIPHMLHVNINAQTPPVIPDNSLSVEPQFLQSGMTQVITSPVNNTGVTLTWRTTEPARTQIEYGTTAAYGQTTPLSSQLVTSHTQTLTGLTPGTTYHYRISSVNASGAVVKSPNQTFTTITDTNTSTPPKLQIKTPTAGQTINGTQLDIAYTSSGDHTEVDHVHFHIDDGPAFMDISFDGSYQLPVPLGTHKITGYLVRFDHSKINGTDHELTITATSPTDNVAPTVSLTGLSSSTPQFGKINLQATASDNQGISKVQFFVDGNQVSPDVTVSPYSYSWDSFTVTNGTHTVQAKAIDAAGNIGSSSPVTITVQNDANASQVGKWIGPGNWPLVSVHASLLYTGEVLLWDAWEQPVSKAKLWNPATGVFTNVDSGRAMFCSGHTQLADGRILVTGGYSVNQSGGNDGITSIQIFNPATRTWSAGKSMNSPRWYPATLALSDGRAFILSGVIGSGAFADTPEIYDPTTNTNTPLTSIRTTDFRQGQYPFTFHLPTGNVLSISPELNKSVYQLNTGTLSWNPLPKTPIPFGTAVQYQPGKILMSGGGAFPNVNAGPNAAVMDLNNPNPAWRTIAPMKANRYLHNFVVLPDGKVLAVGGASQVSNTTTMGTLSNEIWDPATEQWKTVAAMQKLRMYHSVALLLPDARVLVAGGGRIGDPPNQANAEIYSPPYLFQGTRPTIAAAPSEMKYGSNINIQTPDAQTINKISLISLPSVTHGFNMNQNFLNLEFQQGASNLTVQTPGSSKIAPPGYYMLFILNSAGVPSVSKIVKISETAGVQPTLAATPTSAPTPTSGTTPASSIVKDLFVKYVDTRVKVVTYAEATNGKITIKARNTSKDAFALSGSLANISGVTKLEQYVTDSTNTLARKADVSVSGNKFSLQMAPESTVILTSLASQTLPPTTATTVAPTVPATPTQGQVVPPTATPTKAPTPTIAPTTVQQAPTATLIPTQPFPQEPNQTIVTFNLLLQGIGRGGDNTNPNSGGNPNPANPQKTITVEFIDRQNQVVAIKQGKIIYQPASGNFTGSMSITNLPSSVVNVRLHVPKYLKRIIGTTSGAPTRQLQTTLIAGDANIDNRLSILDLNAILSCYNQLCNANPTRKQAADINDDGKVDQLDINLLFRQINGQSGR